MIFLVEPCLHAPPSLTFGRTSRPATVLSPGTAPLAVLRPMPGEACPLGLSAPAGRPLLLGVSTLRTLVPAFARDRGAPPRAGLPPVASPWQGGVHGMAGALPDGTKRPPSRLKRGPLAKWAGRPWPLHGTRSPLPARYPQQALSTRQDGQGGPLLALCGGWLPARAAVDPGSFQRTAQGCSPACHEMVPARRSPVDRDDLAPMAVPRLERGYADKGSLLLPLHPGGPGGGSSSARLRSGTGRSGRRRRASSRGNGGVIEGACKLRSGGPLVSSFRKACMRRVSPTKPGLGRPTRGGPELAGPAGAIGSIHLWSWTSLRVAPFPDGSLGADRRQPTRPGLRWLSLEDLTPAIRWSAQVHEGLDRTRP